MFNLLALAWLELARLVLDLLGFLLASLDFVLLCFALFPWFVWFGYLLCFGLLCLLALFDLIGFACFAFLCFAYLLCLTVICEV